MGTTVLKRPARQPEPEYPSGDILLNAPPEIPAPSGRGWSQMLMMLPMLAGSAAMALMFAGQRGSTMGYVTGGLFGLSAVGMLATQFGQASGVSKVEMLQRRREYSRHLATQRKKVLKTIELQRNAVFYRNPDPDGLWAIPSGPRVWERLRGHVDFATVRIGLGAQELATPLIPPSATELEKLDPMSALALRRFITTYAEVPDLPVTMALNGFARVYLRGDGDVPRSLVRAILAQVAAFHAPDEMMVAICASHDRRHLWEWVKWLPHALHPTKTDVLGQLRLVSPNITGLEAMLDDTLAARPRFNPSSAESQVGGAHLVVVLDGGDTIGSDHLMTEGGVEGVTILDLTSLPPKTLDRSRLILDIGTDGELHSTTFDGQARIGRADRCGIEHIEALALQLAPLRLSVASRSGEQSLNAGTELVDLLSIENPHEFDVAKAWLPRPNRDRLRVPIGVGPDGLPVELDIKESAQDGMGPHGLLIGATGSGKSELLRTLVLALAATHSSETLNLVLVDFKGGATFTKLDKLPHTSAVITNLADELPLVDRMTDAINGEMLRRQELLRAAGNYASQRDYERARAAGAPLAPLPSLLIICDEFSELLSAKPDFIDMFVQIGRLGRSLGVHLLLASQRLEEGRLRGLDTHLSYRIGLRTFSAMESRVVLGVTDAYELPRSPGHGYMKYGTEPLVRFRAAYVSGVYRSKTAAAIVAGETEDRVQEYSTHYVAPQVTKKPKHVEEPAPDSGGESLLDILVGRLVGVGRPAHQVWLPPLKEPPTLDQLYPPLAADPARGITVTDPTSQGALQVVIGIVDRPFDQRRDVLRLDLAGSAGHVLIVGGPQSGKSTALRTIVTSLAITHTPREAQVYCLDLSSGALTTLRDLPHVGGVATRLDGGQVRRTVAELRLIMTQRERLFADRGIDSMATYRRMKWGGSFPDDPFGDVFLVIDGWASIRSDFDDIEPVVADFANRGLSFGIHVVATAGRWMDVRPAVRDVFGTRLELRLGDPTDSMMDRKAAMNVPEDAPGRGVTAEGMHYLTALPRIDGQQDAASLADGANKLVKDIGAAWDGPGAPPVRLLPSSVPYASVPHGTDTPGIPIGIAEIDLQPVYLDFTTDPHFILFGDGECGKSMFLRAVALGIVDRFDLKQARMIVVDYRRSLLGDVTTEHLIGYGSSAEATQKIISEVVGVMKNRLPPADVTPEQLRTRSWWRGPDLYVLVDDYDLVSGGSSNPLTMLLEFLPQARDVGLHLIVARRSGGASRALYEPVLMRLRELGTPGMVMSGNREEGVLLGNVRPSELPPGRGWLVTRRGGTKLVQVLDTPSQAT